MTVSYKPDSLFLFVMYFSALADDPEQLSGGEIAGIVVGCVAFVAIVSVVVYLVVAKKGPFSRGQTQ